MTDSAGADTTAAVPPAADDAVVAAATTTADAPWSELPKSIEIRFVLRAINEALVKRRTHLVRSTERLVSIERGNSTTTSDVWIMENAETPITTPFQFTAQRDDEPADRYAMRAWRAWHKYTRSDADRYACALTLKVLDVLRARGHQIVIGRAPDDTDTDVAEMRVANASIVMCDVSAPNAVCPILRHGTVNSEPYALYGVATPHESRIGHVRFLHHWIRLRLVPLDRDGALIVVAPERKLHIDFAGPRLDDFTPDNLVPGRENLALPLVAFYEDAVEERAATHPKHDYTLRERRVTYLESARACLRFLNAVQECEARALQTPRDFSVFHVLVAEAVASLHVYVARKLSPSGCTRLLNDVMGL